MNVIISNKQKDILQGLNIDIIKSIEGEFTADELISNFQNLYYQRMILDITALKDYDDIKTLQKLSISLDMDKLILLLETNDDSNGTTEYLSNLISMGIYNFTKNVEGIMYLYNNPNSYRDVAHIHQLKEQAAEVTTDVVYTQVKGVRIIGIKSLNSNAGSTTLTYMMTKALSKKYSIKGIEVDKTDFKYFKDKNLISTSNAEVANVVANNHENDIILIDLNDSASANILCHDILYLLDPSTIMLNKFIFSDNSALSKLKEKKIVLNKSLLSSKDVLDFEYESKLKVFYNLPPLDDRENDSHALSMFLVRLGFDRMNTDNHERKKKLLGLFNI